MMKIINKQKDQLKIFKATVDRLEQELSRFKMENKRNRRTICDLCNQSVEKMMKKEKN